MSQDMFRGKSDATGKDAGDTFKVRAGRSGGGATGRGRSGALGALLTKSLKGRSGSVGLRTARAAHGFGGDRRQRVVVKVSFRNHGGGGRGSGGAGRLLAHAQYLQRDGAGPERERGQFYDQEHDIAEGADERLSEWTGDKRHFRVMLAPESGARILGLDGDLKGFTREVMAGLERDLGVEIDWLAVDHANTDNPHAHVIVRGVRLDGADLVLPREYVAHGLRQTARGVATGMLGERSLADERLSFEREIEGRSLNRLDRAIARDLGDARQIRMQDLGRNDAPEFANALKARVRTLERMGLATEVRRNVLAFQRDWFERLEAAQPVDIRKALARGQLYEPRMGRVAGEVVQLGPRGDHPDRALLVVETEKLGKVLLNTGKREIEGLTAGSLVELSSRERRPEITAVSRLPLKGQVMAIADTALDQELERRADGEARQLPGLASVEAALANRAKVLEQAGLGFERPDGVFAFREGARDQLRQAELAREATAYARANSLSVRDPNRQHAFEGVWTVREVKDLALGKAAFLIQGREVVGVRLGSARAPAVGDAVGLKATRGLGQNLALTPAAAIGPVLGLGLGF